jgi:hypothetical protein
MDHRQDLRLPDIDPAIAQANAIGPVSFAAAMKSARFSIAVLAFFIVMIVGSSQLAKLQHSQQIEISAATTPRIWGE